ncbi:PAS/PAC sensor signal transduction histidine kinase [Hymenobacter roseosalivarius DSM 11622]|uniref:histidine kinase n=1 Tax=Hymenobacter roseosalivarius DSM 11622 TaxID=645990 RepID=A0A1W1UK85_9BACT|nr:PAS domain-containing protein [Hymenobacter roseosalivarius]SMB81449.1 PAS/PAC sensor signal transduction histidine kinase [Hymenobacter roseosalivarius DSM 11622]
MPSVPPVSFPLRSLPADDLLRDLLAVSLTGVIYYTPLYDPAGDVVDFTFVYLNPAAQRMMRMPEVPTRTHHEQWPHSIAHGTFQFLVDAFVSGEPRHYDVNYQADGSDNYCRLAARRSGEGLLVSFTDTADQPRGPVEEALRRAQAAERAARADAEEQRAALARAFEQAPVPIAILRGPEFVVELANPSLGALWGRPVAPALGRPLFEALPDLGGQGLEELLTTALRTGESVAFQERPTVLDRAQAGLPALGYYNFTYQPLHDAQGKVTGLITVGIEVTEQVRARQLLEEQSRQLTQLNQELEARVFERTQALRHARAEAEATAQQLQRVTESQPGMSFTFDQAGQVFYLSPQWYAYTGMKPGTDLTAAWPQFVHPDDRPAVVQGLGETLAQGRPWRYEFRLRGADGHYRWITSQGTPEPLADAEAAGRPRQWFGSTLDIDELKRAQQQIEEQDQLLTSILSSLPASVVTFEGEDLRFGFFNEAYQHLAQGRVVPGRPAVEVFPEAAEQGFLASLRGVLRTGEPYQGQEVPAYARDPRTGQQQEMYLDLAYLPLRHGQQPPHAVLGFILDVTDRVRARRQAEAAQAQALAAAEQAAAQREAFYQLFEQTPACIAQLREPGHRFEYVNDAYQQLFPDRQLVSRTVAEALPEAVEHGFLALLDGVLRTGETYFGLEMLLPVTRTDGQPPRDTYFDFTYQATREAGHIVGISIFATDVTERVRARRQREAQQAQLHNLFMEAPAPIVILDGPALTYQLVNPAYQQIFPGRELLGLPLLDALPELAGTDVFARLDQVYQTGVTYVVQELPVQLARRTGGPLEEIYFTFTYQARRDERGAVDGALVFAYEVTDQVRARQQLAQANAELKAANRQLTHTNTDLDNFIYSASHDLKQPIANIEGLLDALHEELPADLAAALPVGPILARMASSVERFQRTLDHLTDITRLQKEYAPAAVAVRVPAVLDDVCLDLAPQLAASGARLTRDVAQCPPLLFAEKNLRSVLFNLLSNALKYRSPHRTLHVAISCHAVPGYQVLEVHDNGLGIPLAQQPRLFGMFQRFHDHVEGTGVGLFMVKRMVENAGGRIDVHSQEGTGTTFFVYFPVADTPTA